ncbi:MAG: hypothetical protein HY875_12870 [Chloroflexi bacterium]|nr:hypothetical protein [Chloroflexota bacterium]
MAVRAGRRVVGSGTSVTGVSGSGVTQASLSRDSEASAAPATAPDEAASTSADSSGAAMPFAIGTASGALGALILAGFGAAAWKRRRR